MEKNLVNSCIGDCRELIEIAEELMASRPEFGHDARSWFAKARALYEQPDVDSFGAERELDALACELRDLWLMSSFNATAPIMKSPPHGDKNCLPSGGQIWFDYERAFKPERLENKLSKSCAVPDGWENAHILFSSAMGALMTIAQVFGARLDGVNPDKAVRLGMFGGYFETWRMLNYLHDRDLEIAHLDCNTDVQTSVSRGEVDVMLLEPVSYDWDMEVFDIDGFHVAYTTAEENAPRLVIIDTTLVGTHFPLSDFLSGFKGSQPWLVLCVRSGLKLDQQGLELANVGVVDIYVPTNAAAPITAVDAHYRLMVARTVFGVGLSVNDAGILEAPWTTDQARLRSFSEAVFRNNEDFASRVVLQGDIFTQLAHPAIHPLHKDHDGAVAPFVMLHLPISQQRSFGHLVAILLYEIDARDLNWQMGSSFGFRGHRFEIIKANVQVRPNKDQYGMLKVAVGSRGGPSIEGILQLVNEIAAYPDWQALKLAYSHVPAYVKGKAGLFVARPPRPV